MFRSFQPFLNPIGFGASDFLELVVAGLVLLVLLRPIAEPYLHRLAGQPVWCAALVAALPVGLRMMLLAHHPAPAPVLYDEFSHLLVADTVRHLRLANPVHPLHQFFESFFVLQEPSYSSIYPLGQGIVLAVGRALFGHPWAGVVLSVAAFCGLCYWMLRGWTTPTWALFGGLLTALEFGPLNQWMNSYWGGAVSASAGCLVFGALPRLIERRRPRDAVLLGMGLSLQLITRPYEFLLLILCAGLFFIPMLRELRVLARIAAACAIAMLPAAGLTLLHNRQVTGSWTTLPEALSQWEYGVPTTFTVQPNPAPHRTLTPQQELGYQMQVTYHGSSPETLERYLRRLQYRMRFYRFFFFAPFYLALPAFLLLCRQYRFAWVAMTLAIFSAGANFYPFFFPHYIGAITCLFVLVTVAGLRRWNRRAATVIAGLGVLQFGFWYGLHFFEGAEPPAILRYETWDLINHGGPDRRAIVRSELAATGDRKLVFVRYWPQHIFQDEWVYNEAEIDQAAVVWARDLGSVENEKLRRYYPGRQAWLLEPDARPPKLSPYPEPVAAPPPTAEQANPSVQPSKPVLRFEEVK